MNILMLADFSVGPSFVTCFLGVVAVILLYWYSSRKQSYWKEIGIPYAKPLPVLGSLLESMKKPLQFIDVDRFNKYGRIYGHYEGNRALLSVTEPEILRNIFVKDFQAFTGRRSFKAGDKVMDNVLFGLRGEDWKRVRTIVSPTFTTGKLKRMMGIFKECSKTLVKNFRKASEKGEPVDTKSIYSAFAMDTIASTAFSTKIDSLNDPKNKFTEAARQFFPGNLNWRMAVFGVFLFLFPGVIKYLKISFIAPKSIEFLSETVLQIIQERRRTGQKRNDFLQLLIDTSKETGDEGKLDLDGKDDITDNYGKIDSIQVSKAYYPKKNLSHEELVAQCVMFFLGGFDTTATALAFASYELALHPDIQERLIQEVDEALTANDGELTYEALQRMKYLDNVIAETLRLYPPIVRVEREADVDYELGDTGLTVPKGMIITIPIYALHRDPELFPNPEKFDPERFSPEERDKQVPYSYLPFGSGPKNCVAMRFALLEMKVCLAHVLSNFRIKKCPTTEIPPEYYLGLGLLLPKRISLFMEIRKDSVEKL